MIVTVSAPEISSSEVRSPGAGVKVFEVEQNRRRLRRDREQGYRQEQCKDAESLSLCHLGGSTVSNFAEKICNCHATH